MLVFACPSLLPKQSGILTYPQWPQWLEALKKEYGGLLSEGMFDELGRSALPEDTKVLPTQLLFNT